MKIKRKVNAPLEGFRFVLGKRIPEQLSDRIDMKTEWTALVDNELIIHTGDYVVIDEDDVAKRYTAKQFRDKFEVIENE